MRIFALVLACLSILFTLLPFNKSDAWWIRIFDFPRAQIAVLCFISLLLLFRVNGVRILHKRMLIFFLAAALVYQLSLIIVFTPLYPVEAPASTELSPLNSMKILQSNVKMDNREVARFKQMVYKYKPDILSINEPDKWWAEQLLEFDTIYPYSIKKPLDNTYGMILYSKFPLEDEEINFLVVDSVPSFYTKILLPSGNAFDLHCVHPEPPKPGSPTYQRDTELLIIAKTVKDAQRPSIVVGDLNDVAWSSTTKKFRKVSGVVDPRQGRGLFNTYNAYIPLFRYPLDHIFYTKHFGLNSLEKLDAFGSDHFAMLISLTLMDERK